MSTSSLPKDFDPRQVSQLAASPAGKQLIALLQRSGGTELQKAITDASAGNYAQAQSVLAPLLRSPEIQALLKQLGG